MEDDAHPQHWTSGCACLPGLGRGSLGGWLLGGNEWRSAASSCGVWLRLSGKRHARNLLRKFV